MLLAASTRVVSCRGITQRTTVSGPARALPSRRFTQGVVAQLRTGAAWRARATGGRTVSTRSRTHRRRIVALVNVDLGPSTVVGIVLICSGAALYQVRAVRPGASRDYDIFFSSVALLVGGILCFQGWRLDPILLFGQILTITAAIAFGVEAIQLRKENESDRPWEKSERSVGERRGSSRARGRPSGYELPSSWQQPVSEWEGEEEQQPRWQQPVSEWEGEEEQQPREPANRAAAQWDEQQQRWAEEPPAWEDAQWEEVAAQEAFGEPNGFQQAFEEGRRGGVAAPPTQAPRRRQPTQDTPSPPRPLAPPSWQVDDWE